MEISQIDPAKRFLHRSCMEISDREHIESLNIFEQKSYIESTGTDLAWRSYRELAEKSCREIS